MAGIHKSGGDNRSKKINRLFLQSDRKFKIIWERLQALPIIIYHLLITLLPFTIIPHFPILQPTEISDLFGF